MRSEISLCNFVVFHPASSINNLKVYFATLTYCPKFGEYYNLLIHHHESQASDFQLMNYEKTIHFFN